MRNRPHFVGVFIGLLTVVAGPGASLLSPIDGRLMAQSAGAQAVGGEPATRQGTVQVTPEWAQGELFDAIPAPPTGLQRDHVHPSTSIELGQSTAPGPQPVASSPEVAIGSGAPQFPATS